LPLIDRSKKILDVYTSNEYETKNYLDYKMLIMAGGKGTRLRPLTNNTPKPLLLVNGKPIIEQIILSAKKQGIYNFIISIHYLGNKIKKFLGDGKRLGVKIKYIQEKVPLGTVGSLYLVKKFNKPLIVSNADIISNIDFQELINYHKKFKSLITVSAINISEKNQYGKIIFKKNKLLKIEEKKDNKNLINAGIYVLNPKIKSFFKKKEYIDMTDLISKIVKKKDKVHIFPLYESWLDYGLKKNIKRHYYN
jgi:NDP-sugar pyrophosphorylase family protein